MKTKILVALLAVSVVGAASAKNVSISGAQGQQFLTSACLNKGSCSASKAYSLTSTTPLMLTLVCQNNSSIYSAPTAVSANYNEGKVTCAIISSLGNAIGQDGNPYMGGVGGMAQLLCSTTEGTATSITVSSVTCPASGSVAKSTAVTNNGTLIANNPKMFTATSSS